MTGDYGGTNPASDHDRRADTPPVSRRGLLGLLLGAGALTACGAPTANPARPQASPPSATAVFPSPVPPTGSGPAVMVDRAINSGPSVALTFHGSGPVPITRQVMRILAEHSARATVLAVGTWLAQSPEVVKLILDTGSELGNHTWSHPQLSRETPAQIYQQIMLCRRMLIKLTGNQGAFFRQSDGQYPTPVELAQAGRAGYRRVLAYDIDSTDWLGTSTAAIRQAVAKAGPGSVISLHLGRANTVAALPSVLADLSARGLTALTASELLAAAPARTTSGGGRTGG